jgi:hypothetical protein
MDDDKRMPTTKYEQVQKEQTACMQQKQRFQYETDACIVYNRAILSSTFPLCYREGAIDSRRLVSRDPSAMLAR